jgi:hypothetical protein
VWWPQKAAICGVYLDTKRAISGEIAYT